jgi:hypothetical protein
MIRIIILSLTLWVLYGCHTSVSEAQIQALNIAIKSANLRQEQMNEGRRARIVDYTGFPASHQQTMLWHLKAKRINKLTVRILKMIDSAEKAVESSSANTPGNELISEGRAALLFDCLLSYRDEIFEIVRAEPLNKKGRGLENFDRLFRQVVDSVKLLKGYDRKISQEKKIKWLDSNFRNASKALTMGMLLKIRNDVLCAEENALFFCEDNSYTYTCVSWSLVGAMSSGYVRPGDSIQSYIGMGRFIIPEDLIIVVNGDTVPVNKEGLAIKNIEAPATVGKYKVKVLVRFKEDGKELEMEKEMKYEVIK